MGWRNDIDIMATLLLEADHNASKVFTGYLITMAALTDIVVLAKFAGKVTVGNKDST
jgi:hypothetical protein